MSARTSVPDSDVLVIGAGPTGLAAAAGCVRAGLAVTIVERAGTVGGLARSAEIAGFEVDPGGHRLLATTARQRHAWSELADELDRLPLHRVGRRSGILRRGRVLAYPVEWRQFAQVMPLRTRLRAAASMARRRVRPLRNEDSLSAWVTNRYGDYLTDALMDPHARKVFGVEPTDIPAAWAAQRIAVPPLREVLKAALPRLPHRHRASTEVDHFLYPDGGLGRLWSRFAESLAGANLLFDSQPVAIGKANSGELSVDVLGPGGPITITAGRIISTAPPEDLAGCIGLTSLSARLARHAIRRDLIVALVRLPSLPRMWENYQWLYTHDVGVRANRFQNYGAWKGLACPPGLIGLEYTIPSGQLPDYTAQVHRDLSIIYGGEYELLGFDTLHNAYANFEATRGLLEEFDAEMARFGSGLISTGRQGAGVYINLDQALRLGRRAASMPPDYSGVLGGGEYSSYQERR
ncbi:FAD-dependent oxidoreductase [Nocardia abscessus]|uniref:FAD-dependent oxidoreductase n=1 Tax=Nocardia abscessus TaxID=120957 RepID=UPI0024565E4B|nr:FAD-dependent oxidoreductase [Nocardia abscessus]